VQHPAGTPGADNELTAVAPFPVSCAIRYQRVRPCDAVPERTASWRGGDCSLGPFRRAGIASSTGQVSVLAGCAITPSALKHSVALRRTTAEGWTGRRGFRQAKGCGCVTAVSGLRGQMLFKSLFSKAA